MPIPQHRRENKLTKLYNHGHKISKRFRQADYSNTKAHKHSWSISSSYKFLILTGAGIKMSSDKRLWFKKKEKILITTYVYSKHVWGTCGTQCRCKSTKLHVQLYGKACISHLSVHDKAENSLFPVEFTKIPGNGKTVFWAFMCYCLAFSPN